MSTQKKIKTEKKGPKKKVPKKADRTYVEDETVMEFVNADIPHQPQNPAPRFLLPTPKEIEEWKAAWLPTNDPPTETNDSQTKQKSVEEFLSGEQKIPEDFGLSPEMYAIFRELDIYDWYIELVNKSEKGRATLSRDINIETMTIRPIEEVLRIYVVDFLREPIPEFKERECAFGLKCILKVIPQTYPVNKEKTSASARNSTGFVGREFLLPSELKTWKTEGVLPVTRRLCICCNRFRTTCIAKMSEVRGNHVLGVVQDHYYKVATSKSDQTQETYNINKCLPIFKGRPTGIVMPFVAFNLNDLTYGKVDILVNAKTKTTKSYRCVYETMQNFQ